MVRDLICVECATMLPDTYLTDDEEEGFKFDVVKEFQRLKCKACGNHKWKHGIDLTTDCSTSWEKQCRG